MRCRITRGRSTNSRRGADASHRPSRHRTNVRAELVFGSNKRSDSIRWMLLMPLGYILDGVGDGEDTILVVRPAQNFQSRRQTPLPETIGHADRGKPTEISHATEVVPLFAVEVGREGLVD